MSATAWAGPTGLAIIPTADLVPFHQVNAVVQNGNTAIEGDQSVLHRPQPVLQAEAGLPWNLETGIDVMPASPPHDDYRPALNLKWVPLHEDYHWPALGVGLTQLGVGFTPAYFLVASRTLNFSAIQYQKFRAHHRNIKLRGIRAHVGVQGVGNTWHGFVGSDIEVSEHAVIYLDWTSGAANALSFGGVLVIDRANSITAAALRFNGEDGIGGVLVNFTHAFTW